MEEFKSIYEDRGIITTDDAVPDKREGFARPIKSIFLGIIEGVGEYLHIFPKGYCPRCGCRMKKQKSGERICPNDGLVIHPHKGGDS